MRYLLPLLALIICSCGPRPVVEDRTAEKERADAAWSEACDRYNDEIERNAAIYARSGETTQDAAEAAVAASAEFKTAMREKLLAYMLLTCSTPVAANAGTDKVMRGSDEQALQLAKKRVVDVRMAGPVVGKPAVLMQ